MYYFLLYYYVLIHYELLPEVLFSALICPVSTRIVTFRRDANVRAHNASDDVDAECSEMSHRLNLV